MKLVEKTPSAMRCVVGGCPAVFETDRATYVIVGARVEPTTRDALAGRIGLGEVAVEVPATLLSDILTGREAE